MKKKIFLLPVILMLIMSSCNKEKNENVFQNGNYYAEMSVYHYNWKAFLDVSISDDKFVEVDFDYFNEGGQLKSNQSYDDYPMADANGNPFLPSEWLPGYENLLLQMDLLTNADVDIVSGATNAGTELNELLDAVLEAAKSGDTEVQIVE